MTNWFSSDGYFVARDASFLAYHRLPCISLIKRLLMKMMEDSRLTGHLRDLSMTYVLFGNSYVPDGEKSWEEILSPDVLRDVECDGFILLGFVQFEELSDVVVVKMIKSFIPGCGVFRRMIQRLEERFKDIVLPEEIIHEDRARKVWLTHLSRYMDDNGHIEHGEQVIYDYDGVIEELNEHVMSE